MKKLINLLSAEVEEEEEPELAAVLPTWKQKELLNEVAPGTENPTQNAANTVQISISSESIVGNDSADLVGEEAIRIVNFYLRKPLLFIVLMIFYVQK